MIRLMQNHEVERIQALLRAAEQCSADTIRTWCENTLRGVVMEICEIEKLTLGRESVPYREIHRPIPWDKLSGTDFRVFSTEASNLLFDGYYLETGAVSIVRSSLLGSVDKHRAKHVMICNEMFQMRLAFFGMRRNSSFPKEPSLFAEYNLLGCQSV